LRKFRVVVNGKEYSVEVEELSSGKEVDSAARSVLSRAPTAENTKPVIPVNKESGEETKKAVVKEEVPSSEKIDGGVKIVAPMSGTILDVFVSVGDTVKSGQRLVLLEAMKMENNILAENTGPIREVRIKKGDSVEAGDIMLILD
jgi:biotin carboxyl carrier protein